MANASKQMGAGAQGKQGPRSAGTEPPGSTIDELDIASDMMGNNRLQGSDQRRTHNQRQAQAETRAETDDVIESLEKLDKDVRAERDLGKGNRH